MLFFLVMEEAAEDGIAREDLARAHRLIYTFSHSKHAVAEASVDDKEENLGVG